MQNMSDEPEHHEINASEATQEATASLLDVVKHVAKELPEEKRYDVSIRIEEVDNEWRIWPGRVGWIW